MAKASAELNTLQEKLKNNRLLVDVYDVTMEKDYVNFMIRVIRKEKPPPEKYMYSPNIDLFDTRDPDKKICFDVHIESSYLIMSQVYVTPCKLISRDYDDSKYAIGLGKKQFIQNISFGEADIEKMGRYIINTEWNIMNERTNKANFLNSNEHLCANCKCKLIGPDGFR